jgi:hypothetical protein
VYRHPALRVPFFEADLLILNRSPNFSEREHMITARGPLKAGRVTITFSPVGDERIPPNVPSTFSVSDRSYQWRRLEQMNYMIVPRKISNSEVQVDIFLTPQKKGKLATKELERAAQLLVDEKISTEWKGLRLTGIGRPTIAKPPQKSIVRGTIEEILGTSL